jgi:hypothetical protein
MKIALSKLGCAPTAGRSLEPPAACKRIAGRRLMGGGVYKEVQIVRTRASDGWCRL